MTFNFTEFPDAGSPVRRRTAHGPSGSDTDEDDAASPIEARDSRTFSTTASPTTSPIPPSAQAPGSMEGIETSPGADVAPRNERLFDPDASIVLIGCRGAGKRSLAFIGALHLRRRLVTEDSYFEQQTGLTRAGFLAKHGKDALGRRSADVFKRMLSAHDRRCIIVCGFGSFSEEGHAALRAFGAAHPVVYVHREKEHVSRFLDPADADHILKADRTHRDCANFEYYNLYDPDDRSGCGTGGQSTPADPTAGGITTDAPSKLLNAKEDFTRFLDLLHSQAWRRTWLESPFSVNAVPPHFRAFSCALRLRLSYLVTFSPSHWDDADLEAQGDCVELIIDHWPDDLLTVVARTVALVRRKLAVPIIFHVEETPRGERKRSLAERDATDTKLLDLGLHLNVDYISLDLQRTPSLVRRVLARKGRTKVVGNIWYTGFGAPAWSDPVQEAHYRRAQALGCDVVRMVRFCAGDSTHERLVEFRERIERTIPDPKPVLVAYDYSVLGVRTPLQPAVFRPIKLHGSETIRDHLATVCSYRGSTELLFQDFTLVPLRFYTLGAHVTYSITPAIHNAAYAFTGLKHSYHAVRTETLEQVASLCGQPTFGGATLAAPFKVAILPSVQLTSQHAAAIGAVNVVIPLRGAAADGSPSQRILDHCNARNRAGQRGLGGDGLYGDNTDWSSILACLRRAMSPRNYVRPSTTSALVIGAGGMARAAIYALLQLGCRNIVVHNRTTARAHEVAAHFNEWATKQLAQGLGKEKENQAVTVVHVITDVRQPWPASFDPPTMVVSCVPAMSNDGSPPPDFEMPRQWLGSTTGGVVVELAYEPLITPLVAQMRNLRTSFSSTPSSPTMSSLPAASPAWRVVDGLDVVGEMAISAFELNTGCVAPRRLMRDVCRRTWEEQRRQHGIGEADEGDGDDDEYGGSYTTSVSGMGVGSGIDGGTNGTYGHGEAMEE